MRQEEAIKYFVSALSKIEGVRALFLKGSLARGTGDSWSDVDLYCLMEAQHLDQFMQVREQIVKGYKSVILFEEVDFGKPQLIAIYDNHLHVDLYGTTELPDVSFEPIKVLYDPGHVLPNNGAIVRNHEEMNAEVVDHLNEVIYTFHELDIAIKRSDFIWAQRLGSHIIAGLSLALCNQYHTNLPILHIKNLTQHLPESLRDLLLKSGALLGKGHYEAAIKQLLRVTIDVIDLQEPHVKGQLRLGFLQAFADLYA